MFTHVMAGINGVVGVLHDALGAKALVATDPSAPRR
jgi:hypothetical protein